MPMPQKSQLVHSTCILCEKPITAARDPHVDRQWTHDSGHHECRPDMPRGFANNARPKEIES